MEILLKKLKNIEPDREFKERSRALILNSPQASFHPRIFQRFLEMVQYSAAFSLTAVLVFLILGGLSILNQRFLSPAILSSLDQKNLNEEEQNLDIQIQLSQADYYADSAKKIEVALKETSGELEKTKNRDKELNQLLDSLTL